MRNDATLIRQEYKYSVWKQEVSIFNSITNYVWILLVDFCQYKSKFKTLIELELVDFHGIWTFFFKSPKFWLSEIYCIIRTHRHFAYPWIGLTLTIIIMDLVSTGFIFSDTGKWTESAETETMENGVYAFVAMLLYTSRGFIVLFYNMVLLILILNSIFTQV